MPQPLLGPRKASYALFVIALLVVSRFGLGPCLLAGLFSYMVLDRTHHRLRQAGAGALVARVGAVGLFAVVITGLALIFASFIKMGLTRAPMLLDRVLPRLDELATSAG